MSLFQGKIKYEICQFSGVITWLLFSYFKMVSTLSRNILFIYRYTNKTILILYGKIQSNVLWIEVDHIYSKYFDKKYPVE